MTSMTEPEEVTPFDGEPEVSVKLRQYVADGYDGTLGTAGEAGMRIGGKASELAQYIATLRHRAERMERVVDLLRIVSVLPSPDLLTDGDWADLCDAVRALTAAEGA